MISLSATLARERRYAKSEPPRHTVLGRTCATPARAELVDSIALLCDGILCPRTDLSSLHDLAVGIHMCAGPLAQSTLLWLGLAFAVGGECVFG